MTTPYEHAVAQVREQAVRTIDVAGETFTLHGEWTTVDMAELARAEGLDQNSAEGAAVLAESFRAVFGADLPGAPGAAGRGEYARFRRHLRSLTATLDVDQLTLMALADAVVAFSGFPTEQPSASPASSSRSTPSSRDAGSQPAAPVVASTTVDTPREAVVEEPDEDQPPATPRDTVVVNLGRRAS